MRKPFIQVIVLGMASAGCGSAPNISSASPVESPGVQPVAAAGSGAAAMTVKTQPAMTGVAASTPSTMPARAASAPAASAPTAAAPSTPAASMTAAAPANSMGAAPSDLPRATGGAISEACRGFDFNGLVYSPGGDIPPNKCEAFHPTVNSAYAVRCIDVWPWYKTKYPGDNFCILPPPPDKGIQVGHHPQGEGDAWFKAVSQGDMSGYDNPPADWTLASGGEEERNITIQHTNPGGKYYRILSRMRGGSHHMIPSIGAAGPATFTWGPGSPEGLFTGLFPGAQRPDDNLPPSNQVPEEDADLYREFPANAAVVYNMHHFNSTGGDILKEVWQNIWWTENAATPIKNITGLPLTQVATVFANPGEIADMHYATTLSRDMRLLGFFGHRHAWTTAFTVWLESANTEPAIVYQSFDWFDEPTYVYNSATKNPAPAPDKGFDGGHTGLLNAKAGDKLHFNCHIEYTDERAEQEKSPVKPAQNGPLRFANQAYTAEMCILFGESVGDVGAFEQLGPPPDFAKHR